MTRPFSHTLQAHQFDRHRMWMVLLIGAIFLALAWIGWATSDSFAVDDETCRSLQLHPKFTISTSHEPHGVILEPKTWLEATFPAAARSHVTPGQEVTVSVDGAIIPALITEVRDNPATKEIQAILRVESAENAPDPFARKSPEWVRIPVGRKSPLEIWLPEVAPRQKPKTLDHGRLQQ